ncbi:MAG: zinc ribbon domain-containing protein [Chlorobi bacterium]|nr:zinc ribbon domain-containing protein [Chlorobiota bacterium]
MPTYDYKCLDCGDTFEYFQSMKDEPLKVCKKCGGQLKRLIGAGLGPIFKGSGFYETDYKRKSNGNGTKTSVSKNAETGSSVPAKVAEKKDTKKAS